MAARITVLHSASSQTRFHVTRLVQRPFNGRGGKDKKCAGTEQRGVYKQPWCVTATYLPFTLSTTRRQHTSSMATQRFVDALTTLQMNLSRLQTEVSNGTYVFKRPLTIINWIRINTLCTHSVIVSKVYRSMGNGYYCLVHQWGCVPLYRFALRVLVSDWEGGEIWAVIFNELAKKVLGFDANTYVGMKSMKTVMPHCPCSDGDPCHGHHQETRKGHVCELHRVRAGRGRVVILFAGIRQRG